MQPRAHLCIAFRLCGKGERKVLGAKSLQSCPTIRDPKDCSPPGFSVQRILQARLLDWVDMPSSQDLPAPGIEPMSLMSPALRADSLPLVPPGKP